MSIKAHKPKEAPRRTPGISPELSEVLHMLKSLEAELAREKAAAG